MTKPSLFLFKFQLSNILGHLILVFLSFITMTVQYKDLILFVVTTIINKNDITIGNVDPKSNKTSLKTLYTTIAAGSPHE